MQDKITLPQSQTRISGPEFYLVLGDISCYRTAFDSSYNVRLV